MSGTDAGQVTVTVTRHRTRIPVTGEMRDCWRGQVAGLDVAARGSTPKRALENTVASIRDRTIEERLESVGGDA